VCLIVATSATMYSQLQAIPVLRFITILGHLVGVQILDILRSIEGKDGIGRGSDKDNKVVGQYL
jgi:xanthosine utilization system XapX-like protein